MALGDAHVALARGGGGRGVDRRVGFAGSERHSWRGARGRTRGGDEPRHAGRLGGVHAVLLENRRWSWKERRTVRARGRKARRERESPRAQNTKNCLWSHFRQSSRPPARTNDGSRGTSAGSDEAAESTPVARVSMASIAAAGAAAAAIGVWYSQRRAPQLSEFTEPPKTWGDAVLRLHEVVRVSWKEALSKLGIWRLDHLLAIRHLSSRDLSVEIAEEIKAHGVRVEVRATRAPSPPRARPFAEFADGTAPSARAQHAFPATSLTRLPSLPRTPRAGRRGLVLAPRVHRHGDALQPAPPRRAERRADHRQARPLPRGHPAESTPSRHPPARVHPNPRSRRASSLLRHPRHALRPRHRHLAHRSPAPAPRHRRGRRPRARLRARGFPQHGEVVGEKHPRRPRRRVGVQPGVRTHDRRAQPRRRHRRAPHATPSRARGGRSRAEPLRGRRVPRVRVSVVSLQGTERELPTVHHHRRLQRGRRPARQFQQSVRAASADRQRRVGTTGAQKMARDHPRHVSGVRRAPREKTFVASRDGNDGIPAPRPRSRRAPGVAHVRPRRPAATRRRGRRRSRRGVGGWRDGAPSGRRRRRARRSSSTVARRADAFAATRRGRRRRKQTRQVGEHKRRAHRGVRRSEKLGREFSRTRGRFPPRRVGVLRPRR